MLHIVHIGAADPLELDSIVQTTLRAFVPVFGPLQMTDLIGHDTLRGHLQSALPELATDRTASRTIDSTSAMAGWASRAVGASATTTTNASLSSHATSMKSPVSSPIRS
jgi:3-hydroxyacyl-CoA dehydrogenase